MKTESQTYRSWMSAVTFAEAGEWETAQSMIPLPTKSKWGQFFENMFAAVAFAEEGLHDEARQIAGYGRPPVKRIDTFLNSIGLRNVRMAYGVLQEGSVC